MSDTSAGGSTTYDPSNHVYVTLGFGSGPLSVAPTLTPQPGEQKLDRKDAAAAVYAMLYGVEAATKDSSFLGSTVLGFLGKPASMVTQATVKGAALGALRTGVGFAGLVSAFNAAPDVNSDQAANQRADFASKLAALLPDNALYASVLLSMDYRPLLAQVAPTSAPRAGKKFPEADVAGMRFDATEVATAYDALQKANDNEQAAAFTYAQQTGTDPSEMAQRAATFTPGTLTISARTLINPTPATPGSATSGTTTPTDAGGTTTDPSATGSDPLTNPDGTINLDGGYTTSAPDMPPFAQIIQWPGWDAEREQLRELTKADQPNFSLDDLAKFEVPQWKQVTVPDPTTGEPRTEWQPAQPFGPVGIQVSNAGKVGPFPGLPTPVQSTQGQVYDAIPGVGALLPGSAASRKGGQGGLSVIEALNYPKSLTQSEVASLQTKFEQAGLLQKGTYDKGNAWDDKFESAWKQVLTESFQKNIPTGALVGQYAARYQRQKASYEAEQRAKVIEQVPHALDFASIDELVNATALNTIGRPLTLNERQQVITYYTQLRDADVKRITDRLTTLPADQISQAYGGVGPATTDAAGTALNNLAGTANLGDLRRGPDVSNQDAATASLLEALPQAGVEASLRNHDTNVNTVLKRFASFDASKGERPLAVPVPLPTPQRSA